MIDGVSVKKTKEEKCDNYVGNDSLKILKTNCSHLAELLTLNSPNLIIKFSNIFIGHEHTID